METNNILNAREERIQIINGLTSQFDIVILKVNMFGSNKCNNFAKSLLGYFYNQLPLEFKKTNHEYIESFDGAYYLFKFPKGTSNLKEKCIALEDKGLGRLIDLDVYIDSNKSIRRTNPRKCVICDNEAFYCIRSHAHSYDKLEKRYKDLAYIYYSKVIFSAIKFSMITELKLSPKFGCVCYDSNGSHKDLDYNKMAKCAEILYPYFIDMFQVGFYEKDNYFTKINKMGRLAEDKMFSSIQTNCYKGLIYGLGILLTTCAHYLGSMDTISFDEAMEEVLADYFIPELDTFGYHAYTNNFLGIRGEVLSHFKTIKKVYSNIDINDNQKIFKTFLDIVYLCDDSVLLKRAGSMEKYLEYKELISNAYKLNNEELMKLNQKCIDYNISLGGSCDLLVCALFLKYMENEFCLKELI